MIIAVTGATGFIGSNLRKYFDRPGIQIIQIGRSDFEDVKKLTELVNGADVLIHLAGAPIFQRWTDKKKKEILESRINTGEKLFAAVRAAEIKPSLFMTGSGVSLYSREGRHDENSEQYTGGYITGLVLDWEFVAYKFMALGIRSVIMRFGIVLGKGGGALKIMEIPFKMGLGARIGNGKQRVSFIHIDDLCRGIDFLINETDFTGIVNFVSPRSITNEEFAKELARVFNRPCFLTVPKFIVKAVLGEVSVLIAKGEDVEPGVLRRLGFRFGQAEIHEALESIFQKE